MKIGLIEIMDIYREIHALFIDDKWLAADDYKRDHQMIRYSNFRAISGCSEYVVVIETNDDCFSYPPPSFVKPTPPEGGNEPQFRPIRSVPVTGKQFIDNNNSGNNNSNGKPFLRMWMIWVVLVLI